MIKKFFIKIDIIFKMKHKINKIKIVKKLKFIKL